MTARALTRRQQDVLPLIARGMTNRAIARRLGLHHDTVAHHVRTLIARLDANTRDHSVAIAVRSGHLGVIVDRTQSPPPMSDRQLRIIALIAQGDDVNAIGAATDRSAASVQASINKLLRVWHCHNRAHLLMSAFERGVLAVPNGASE